MVSFDVNFVPNPLGSDAGQLRIFSQKCVNSPAGSQKPNETTLGKDPGKSETKHNLLFGQREVYFTSHVQTLYQNY